MFFGLMISVSLAPGCGDNDRGSAIQGRWVEPNWKSALELLEGRTVVRVPFEAGNGIIAGSCRIAEKSVPLLFMKLSNVGSRAHHEGDAVGFAVTNRELTLIRDRRSTVFRREDPPLSPAQKALVGLWKREMAPNAGEVTGGVLFTPGGIEIVIGPDSPWGEQGPGDCAIVLCVSARYELKDDGTIDETGLGPAAGRARSRSIEVTGDRLTIRQPGWEDRIYKRVVGALPTKDSVEA
jgi:hypothetical protein